MKLPLCAFSYTVHYSRHRYSPFPETGYWVIWMFGLTCMPLLLLLCHVTMKRSKIKHLLVIQCSLVTEIGPVILDIKKKKKKKKARCLFICLYICTKLSWPWQYNLYNQYVLLYAWKAEISLQIWHGNIMY